MDYRQPLEALIPGAQGRILGVLARTDSELTLRSLAGLARVSSTHASRVLPRLVSLGLIERRDVGSSALFRLVPQNLAARWIRAVAALREALIEELRASTAMVLPPAANVTLFGSLARGEGRQTSDVDLLLVVAGTDESFDERRAEWERYVAALAGNPVNVIEVDMQEAVGRRRDRSGLWRAIVTEGICLGGEALQELSAGRGTARGPR